MINCNFCGAPLDDDALFCTNCGKKIETQGRTCPQCGSEVEEDSLFCAKCGTRLDEKVVTHIDPPQIVTPEVPLQKEEDVIYDWEEGKDRKWWYIIGGIVAVVLLTLGWYGYKHHLAKPHNENLELTIEEDSFFVERVNNWNELHNIKGFENNANSPYAESVYYYGSKMSGLKAAQEKQKALMRVTNYTQECTNIKVTKLTDKLVVCDFEKHTNSNGKSKVHPNCYLYFSKEDGEVWKIKEESDLKTDENLLNKRTNSRDEVILPITLQLIRKYCDHLVLPYNYWTYVENEIIEKELNVYHCYAPLWPDPYIIRGSIAMDYKYGNENPVYEKLCVASYLCFCDAIGRIKDVWNVVPYKVEDNTDENEQPLFQFKYIGEGLEDIIITARYVQDGEEEIDDIPIYHYEYYDDNNKEVKMKLLPN